MWRRGATFDFKQEWFNRTQTDYVGFLFLALLAFVLVFLGLRMRR